MIYKGEFFMDDKEIKIFYEGLDVLNQKNLKIQNYLIILKQNFCLKMKDIFLTMLLKV